MTDFTDIINITTEADSMRLIDKTHEEKDGRLIITCRFSRSGRSDSAAGAKKEGQALLLQEGTSLVRITFSLPGAGVCGLWRPDGGFHRELHGDWDEAWSTRLCHSAPVFTLFSGEDENILSFACSEVSAEHSFSVGVHEETGEIAVRDIVTVPDQAGAEEDEYRLQLYLDTRRIRFSETVKEVSAWWDELLPDAPAPVPETARMPMYSTWYAFHQNLEAFALETEYKRAAQMGMQAVIIDDGWQTSDVNRGYGYCGDWQVCPEKFSDSSRHVRVIHELGMRCILWHSVPFVGRWSKGWERFQSMLLHYDPSSMCGTLDPRYPQVREYLIETFTGAVRRWDLDGLKLDFVDWFHGYEDTPSFRQGMDLPDIQAAACVLMRSVYRAVTALRPDAMIEFRQPYAGPQMRRFGNIFRVLDCPMSGVSNRVGTADLKLLGGNTAVHSDMLMWHADEKPEDVAIQMMNSIFAVFQISVRLSTMEPAVRKTAAHYLTFAVRYRKVLQEGEFQVFAPLCNDPVLQASDGQTCITARYDRNVLVSQERAGGAREWWILNGCRASSVPMEITLAAAYRISVFDCTGECLRGEEQRLEAGLYRQAVPAGGSLRMEIIQVISNRH